MSLDITQETLLKNITNQLSFLLTKEDDFIRKYIQNENPQYPREDITINKAISPHFYSYYLKAKSHDINSIKQNIILHDTNIKDNINKYNDLIAKIQSELNWVSDELKGYIIEKDDLEKESITSRQVTITQENYYSSRGYNSDKENSKRLNGLKEQLRKVESWIIQIKKECQEMYKKNLSYASENINLNQHLKQKQMISEQLESEIIKLQRTRSGSANNYIGKKMCKSSGNIEVNHNNGNKTSILHKFTFTSLFKK